MTTAQQITENDQIIAELSKKIPEFCICTNGQNWMNENGAKELIKFVVQKIRAQLSPTEKLQAMPSAEWEDDGKCSDCEKKNEDCSCGLE